MKRVVCILVCLYSTTMACNERDPLRGESGRRAIGPRLSGATWRECCRKAQIKESCDETIRNRDRALELLVDAHGDCLDRVVGAVEKYAKDDLSAAYFLRAQRKDDPVDLLRALKAADDAHSDAARFNRALALEKLGLIQEAMNAWNQVRTAEQTEWSREAVQRRDRLRRYFTIPPSTAQPPENAPPEVVERYQRAADLFVEGKDVLPLLDSIATYDAPNALPSRIHTLRANALEYFGRYTEALDAYDRALEKARTDTARMDVFTRRSSNRLTTGNSAEAFHDAIRAIRLLPVVPIATARMHAFSAAGSAAWELGYRDAALHYRNAAVAAIGRGTGPEKRLKHYRSVALRARAMTLAGMDRDTEAESDLQEASELAEAIGDTGMRDLLRMRIHEIQGQLLMNRDPATAVQHFTSAIALAGHENATYRAILHSERASARQAARDANADADFATALQILQQEALNLLENSRRGQNEDLWSPYFSRFQSMQRQMIERRIQAGDLEGAFFYAEQARAFEPLHLLFQSQVVPPGFHKIETMKDVRRALAELPEDTVILQYVVLDARSYAFVLTRDGIETVLIPVGRAQIEGWLTEINTAVQGRQPLAFTRPMRAAYELVRTPLAVASARNRPRLVISPDGPMHGIPFAGLEGRRDEGSLLARGSIEIAGSTSLYLYALHRDRQFAASEQPRVLIAGDPVAASLGRLEHAKEEAQQLALDYPGSTLLLGENATVRRFLDAAKDSTIIHFAGHSVANPKKPWHSMLALTPQGNDFGALTAQKLLTELPRLDRTRLVVLAACRTAGGQPVGPEGVAPLVRPLIAANVPAVVGTLWDVRDATTKNLMVSLHCHYRNGDDVAVALQQAQLEMLRKDVKAMYWAPFQAVGYAASPYARPIAMETTHHDHVCSENSVHRPDGLHPQ